MKYASFVFVYLFTYCGLQAQQSINAKGYRFYVSRSFGQALQVTDRAGLNGLATEINNINSTLGELNFGFSCDVLANKKSVLSVGGQYSFIGNNLKTIKQGNNSYTYHLGLSSLSVPVELRYYLGNKPSSNLFTMAAITPSVLLNGSLTKKENVFDANQQYLSTAQTNIDNVGFYALNGSLKIGIGIEVNTKRNARIWVLPAYSYQIMPTWSKIIKQNIGMFGLSVGMHLNR